MKLFPCVLLTFAAVFVNHSIADAATLRWEGEWTFAGQRLRIGLELDPDTAPVIAKFQSPSMHLPSLPCSDVERDGDRISLTLPADLGRFEVNVVDHDLEGRITLPDGRHGAARLASAPMRPLVAEAIRFRSGKVELSGEVLRPTGAGPFPGIILVHGGGDSVTRNEGYWFWMEHFARRGFVVLGWDKRGCGESAGAWRDVGLGALASDAAAAAETLASRPDVDAARVGAVGFSQGGWVGPLAATKTDAIKFMANVSGPAVSVAAADTTAVTNAYQRMGLSETECAEALALWRLLLLAMDDDDLWSDYLAYFESVKDHSWVARAEEEPTSPSSWWVGWYRRVKDHDPLAILDRVNIPILWLYGAEDTQLDARQSAQILAELQRSESRPYEIHVFPDAGHGLNRPLGPPDIGPYAIVPGALEALELWLDARAVAE